MFFEFVMERFQSLYENEVDFNLSDSGVHPLTINDLLNEEEMQHFLNMEIGYGYSQGDPTLRENISSGTEIKMDPTSWSLMVPQKQIL